jgi:hypothetical protein
VAKKQELRLVGEVGVRKKVREEGERVFNMGRHGDRLAGV